MIATRFRCLSLALLAIVVPSAFADYPAARILLETDRTAVGEKLVFPSGPSAKVTAAHITISPGTSTGWHRHGTTMFAYVLSGELEVEYADLGRRILKAGDALMEAQEVPHIGANTSDKPVQLLVLYLEDDSTTRTLPGPIPQQPPQIDAPRASDLVHLATFDPRVKLDIRYATTNNFLGRVLYPSAHAYLQRPAAEALKRAHDRLIGLGYGLMVLDAYRPWQVTRLMWDSRPADRAYLADPLKGSRHNRGCAVDVTLYDLKTGIEVSMPSPYDDFTERAHPTYTGGDEAARAKRDLLRQAMEAEGFSVYENEWWHFDFKDWMSYPVLNTPFPEQ
jgi:D-alanyl-D-alanine dipeptidase